MLGIVQLAMMIEGFLNYCHYLVKQVHYNVNFL